MSITQNNTWSQIQYDNSNTECSFGTVWSKLKLSISETDSDSDAYSGSDADSDSAPDSETWF